MKSHIENIIVRVKVAVDHMQNYSLTEFQKKLPSYIHMKYGYEFLNGLFLRQEGISIKDYFKMKKMEKARELLEYYHLEATEAAYQLGYKQPGRII